MVDPFSYTVVYVLLWKVDVCRIGVEFAVKVRV